MCIHINYRFIHSKYGSTLSATSCDSSNAVYGVEDTLVLTSTLASKICLCLDWVTGVEMIGTYGWVLN